MWKQVLRSLLLWAALIAMIAGGAVHGGVVQLQKRSEGFEAAVMFYLVAILCLLWAETYLVR